MYKVRGTSSLCNIVTLKAYVSCILAGVQSDYKKACSLADEKEKDVKNLINQLEEKEQQCERTNHQLKVTEDDVNELKESEK